jgi:flavin reductase (DIM6/NTAB) family NADH-FMN oxidoreductase RutF
MIINPKDTSIPVIHKLMLGAIAPRPIAFVSTVDKEGKPNLSPFSFFQCLWRESSYPGVLSESTRKG